jgi:APA family basic amino acid/polyamine antiporter
MGQRPPQRGRQLGLLDATAIALGGIIGAGVFVVLGEAAGVAEGALPVAFLIAAVVASVSGLSAAELGARYPHYGGPYEFGYELLSPVAGFGGGWLYLLANVVGSATFSLTFADYLGPLAPGLPPRAVAVGLAAGVVAVNTIGVRLSRPVNNLLVAFKIVVLGIFVLVGLAFLGLWKPAFFRSFDFRALPRASALLFFAYAGFARPVVLAAEIRNPARTLPRATIYALSVTAVLYLAVSIVAVGLIGGTGLSRTRVPLRTALAPTGQLWAQVLISLGALVATTDVLLTAIWALSRVVLAMAQRGDLPAVLGRVTPGGVPRVAILAIGTLIVAATAILGFSLALAAASLGQLLYYGITDAAALRLRPDQRLYSPAIPAAGLLFSALLVLSLPVQALLVVAGVLGAGFIYYFLRHR